MYHDPSREVVESHLAWLKGHGYSFLPLDILVEAIEKQDFKRIPPKSVVVTFDDGHQGNIELGEIFEKYQVRPTIFLTTGIVETNRRYWTYEALEAGMQHEEIVGRKMAETLEYLAEKTGFTTDREYPGQRRSLSADEIDKLSASVDFQPHTVTHPVLTQCDEATCRDELEKSKAWVTDRFGCSADHFAYTFGLFGQREKRLLRELGFRSARSTKRGWNHRSTDLFELRIVDVLDNTRPEMLYLAMLNLYQVFVWLRRHCRLPRLGGF